MKTIKMSEKQFRGLVNEEFEYFSLAKLNSIENQRERVDYCIKTLGEPLGEGVGRIVFPIGDDEVLKLALPSSQGVEQNRNEYEIYEEFKNKFSLFTKVYQHADDFYWIITERVIPFHQKDSEIVLGMPYIKGNFLMHLYNVENELDDNSYDEYKHKEQYKFGDYEPSLSSFIDWCANISEGNTLTDEVEDEAYFELIGKEPWCREFYKFMQYTNGDTDIYDANLGLAMRNGKPWIVILDSGFETLKESKRYVNEHNVANDENPWDFCINAIKHGYLIHGTNDDFIDFDVEKIKGGLRSEYGYGMYFSDEAYKALEYGTMIYLTKKKIYNLLDLTKIYDISLFDEIEKNAQELKDVEEKQLNSRNNREYDYYSNLIGELKGRANLTDEEDVIYHLFVKVMKNEKTMSFEQVFKTVRGNLPSSFEKYISSLFLKLGYDGFKCNNQYVIFNFEKLNKNLLKELIE